MKRSIITTFLTGTPSSTYSVATGYSVGSEWINTDNGNRFYQKNDGNWVPLNVESPFYIQSGTVSAFDTTSSVYRTGSLNIGTGTTSSSRFVVSSTSGTTSLIVDNVGNVYNNSKGLNNTLFGHQAGSLTTGIFNTAFGKDSLLINSTGGFNTAFGIESLWANTTGQNNTAVGFEAFYFNGTGSNNTVVGYAAGTFTTPGSNNTKSDKSVFIGVQSRPQNINETNQIVIGYEAYGNGSNTVTLGSDLILATILKGNIGIGVTGPSTKLHVYGTQSGAFRLQDGTQANGYVLTSDANGVATWASFSSSTSSTSIYWYTENTTPPSTAPVATGAGSIAIGNNTKALSSNMFVYGESAGLDATDSDFSNFIGYYAGFQTHTSLNLNVIGNYAGFQSSNSGSSNFIGDYAGFQSSGSIKSNFIGDRAGLQSPGSEYSNFIGGHAGVQSPNTGYSNFFGRDAGNGSPGASYSNFFGRGAGQLAPGAYHSNFIGDLAGHQANVAHNSNFFGNGAGSFAYNANNSIFIGERAGYYASGAYDSNFFGKEAGSAGIYPYSSAYNSNFFGNNAGLQATNANNSNFIGERAGKGAYNGNNSNFFGQGAGQVADPYNYVEYDGIYYSYNAYPGGNNSNFIGTNAGLNSASSNSNFFGQNSGEWTFLAHHSNFFGFYAGAGANNANNSNFFGYAAGQEATNAYNSNLFGYSAGKSFTSNVIGANNIVIGTNISLPNGASNSINIGGVLFGLNTYSDTIGNPSIVAQPNGRIGINVVNPTTNLHVYGTQSGAFRLEDTTQGNGYILTSDVNGVASWTSSLTGLSLLGNSEVISASVSATASVVVYDYSSSSLWYHATASTNFTANFTNLPTTDNRVLSATIVISQGATAYIPNIVQIAGVTQSIKWAGGTQSGTANSLDLISFNFIRTGNAWTSVIGQIAPFS